MLLCKNSIIYIFSCQFTESSTSLHPWLQRIIDSEASMPKKRGPEIEGGVINLEGLLTKVLCSVNFGISQYILKEVLKTTLVCYMYEHLTHQWYLRLSIRFSYNNMWQWEVIKVINKMFELFDWIMLMLSIRTCEIVICIGLCYKI